MLLNWPTHATIKQSINNPQLPRFEYKTIIFREVNNCFPMVPPSAKAQVRLMMQEGLKMFHVFCCEYDCPTRTCRQIRVHMAYHCLQSWFNTRYRLMFRSTNNRGQENLIFIGLFRLVRATCAIKLGTGFWLSYSNRLRLLTGYDDIRTVGVVFAYVLGDISITNTDITVNNVLRNHGRV